jgi:propionyl-CoA carboxylase beta chain
LITKEKIEIFSALKQKALEGGGIERNKQQQARGKLTARQRIALLLDPDSFSELGCFIKPRYCDTANDGNICSGDAVVTGSGKIDGRPVFIYSQDFTVLGGSISEVVGQKVRQIMELALDNKAPVIAIFDSGGARIQEGVDSLCGVGDMLL